MTIHENYNNWTLNNDIGIIELPEEVDLTTYTPACMAKPSDTTNFDGKKALRVILGRFTVNEYWISLKDILENT